MFLQEVELVAHASQGLGHVLLVPPARRIWAQVDTKSNGRSPLLVPVLSRTTIVSQDHLCIIWVKRLYASKVPFPRSSRHDQFQDLSPQQEKKQKMHLAPNKRWWNYSLSSMIHAYPRHMVNIRLDCFLVTGLDIHPNDDTPSYPTHI